MSKLKKIAFSILALILISLLIIEFLPTKQANAATTTVYPVSDGDINNFLTSTGNSRYSLVNNPSTATYIWRYRAASGSFKVYSRVNGVNYDTLGSLVWYYQSWKEVSTTVTKNPQTGKAWTIEEFNNAQFGFKIDVYGEGEYWQFFNFDTISGSGDIISLKFKATTKEELEHYIPDVGTAHTQKMAEFKVEVTYVSEPEIDTEAATLITTNSARLNSTIIDDGGDNCNVRFGYGTTSQIIANFTSYDTVTAWVSGKKTNDTPYVNISGLLPNTTYYFRVQAENDAGTRTGNELTFTTGIGTPSVQVNAATLITDSSARLNGKILNDGGESCEVRFGYGLTSQTQAGFNNYTTHSSWANSYTTDSAFNLDITGLLPNKTYYFNIQVKNSSGTTTGNQLSFKTDVALPEIEAVSATNIGETVARLNSQITDDGGTSCQIRFGYGLVSKASNQFEEYSFIESVTGSFTAGNKPHKDITGLSKNKTYYFRVEITNTAGTFISNELSFVTVAGQPAITANNATNVTAKEARLNSTITDDGGEACEVRFGYGKSSKNALQFEQYEHKSSWVSSYNISDTPYLDLTNLSTATTYYFRVQIKNNAGTYTSNEISFKTLALPPAAKANEASGLSMTGARLNALITDDGGETCQVRWGYGLGSEVDFNSYTTITNWENGYRSGSNVYLDISSLTENTTYYFRLQVKNTTEVIYTTNEISFKTLASLNVPTSFKGIPSGTYIDLSWIRGYGAEKTLIRYSFETYPQSITDGFLLYEGTQISCKHEGLENGQTVYYSAWSKSGEAYTQNFIKLLLTTITGAEAPIDIKDLTEPPKWFINTDYTTQANTPYYEIVNNIIDSIGIPRSTGWSIGAMLFATMLTFAVYTYRPNALLAGAVLLISLGLSSAVWLIPGWVIFVTFLVTFGIAGVQRYL